MLEIKFFKNPLFWLFLTLILIWIAFLSLPDRNLHLIFCKVGQGDATLISYRQTQILVDGGPDNSVLDCLAKNMPFWDRNLEIIILTHPEADHFTGLIEVASRYQIDYFLVNRHLNVSSLGFQKLEELINNYKIKNYAPKKGDKINVNPIQLSFLWPPKGMNDFKGLNDSSLVFYLSFGQFKALLTGDIPSKIEEQLNLKGLKEIDLLKVAHHGSKFSTGDYFLSQIKPKLAVICVGKNSFGHPHPDVLGRLKQRGISYLRTDRESQIEVIADGYNWFLK